MSQLSDTLNLIEYYKRTRGPRRMLRIDNNTHYGGNLGGITVTKKRKKPYFVASRTGLLNASDAAKAQDAMFPYISNLVPNVFRGIDNILKGNYLGAGLEAAKAVGARYVPEILNGTIATGDALATTAAGQKLTSGLNFATNAVRNSKALPWIDAGLSSLFGAQGLDKIRRGDIHNEGDVVETGLDLMPLTQLARPVVNTAGRIGSAIENGVDKAVTAWKYRGVNAKNSPVALLPNANPLVARGGYEVARYPGYLLKGLMGGSPLERQLSKNGTININLLNAYFNKASQLEREVANKVLTKKFAGLKTIDYNLFKKAVLDELIGSYNRVPLTEWADYGMEGLGFETQISHDGNAIVYNEVTGEFEQVAPFTPFKPNYTLNTFTFESPRIPYGNTKHYGGNPIGHSRTYILPEDPHTLYVMESLSDWAQQGLRKKTSIDAQSAYERASLSATKHLQEIELMKANLEKGLAPDGHKIQYEWERRDIEEIIKNTERLLSSNNARAARFDAILHPEKYVLENYLKQNYLQRQLQENLRYAAENGLTKMRYPTPETAAKIEGYEKKTITNPKILDEYRALGLERMLLYNEVHSLGIFDRRRVVIEKRLAEIELREQELNSMLEYSPEHQTILKKYSDFPKLFLKLYKGRPVRTVTDTKGNTWYEVDVPENYLNTEWQFKKGGLLISRNIITRFKNENN